jgi:hypothetical protein
MGLASLHNNGPCETQLSVGLIPLKPLWALSNGPHEVELSSTLVKPKGCGLYWNHGLHKQKLNALSIPVK